MLPRRLEPFLEQLLEQREARAGDSTHDVDVLLFPPMHRRGWSGTRGGRSEREGANHRELERRSFEAHVPWTVREHESEVNVDAVTFAIDEDVSIVPIFDLEEVGRDGVAWTSEEESKSVASREACGKRTKEGPTSQRLDEVPLRSKEASGFGVAVDLRNEKEAKSDRVASLPMTLTSDEKTRATHVHEVVKQADVPDARTSSDPTTVFCLLDRMD